MNYKQHLAIGMGITIVLVFILVYFYRANFSLYDYVVFLMVSILYSLLPDIDHQSSKVRLFITIAFIIGALILLKESRIILAGIVLAGLLGIWLMNYFEGLKHRQFTHYFTTGFIMSIPLIMFDIIFFYIGFVCYTSHLVVDKYITKEGVRTWE